MKKKTYQQKLLQLQIELVKLQKHFIGCGDKILVILEGRDAAGKDGAVKRIVQHLSPRETRVVALGPPSDRQQTSWYFQRFVTHLPSGGEFVLFNRSWYNRAGVERVMGYCSEEDYLRFLDQVGDFERMLVASGIHLFKYYLDISRDEQASRLEARRVDPLKQWKISPVDERALELWPEYGRARDEMLAATHHKSVPWSIVAADDKRRARLAVINDLLRQLDYCDKDRSVLETPDPFLFTYEEVSADRRALAV